MRYDCSYHDYIRHGNILLMPIVHAWRSLSSHSQCRVVDKKPGRLVGSLALLSYTSESVDETTANSC